MTMKITDKQAEEIRRARACGIPPKLLTGYYGITERRVRQLTEHKKPNTSSVTPIVEVHACV